MPLMYKKEYLHIIDLFFYTIDVRIVALIIYYGLLY